MATRTTVRDELRIDMGGFAAASVSGAVVVNPSSTKRQALTLTGNVTGLTFGAGSVPGQEFELVVIQDATGSRTWAGVGSNVKFAGAATPTLTTTAARQDIFRFVWDGTSWLEQRRSLNIG